MQRVVAFPRLLVQLVIRQPIMLMTGVAARLAGALVLVVALWAAVGWALAVVG